MITISLTRHDHLNPNIEELFAMIEELRGFLSEPVAPGNQLWMANLNAILAFQAEDGSFRLLDSYRVPSDARVDFCYIPTYLCTAILMKAYLCAPSLIRQDALRRTLTACCGRSLRGHGYDAFRGQLEALEIFIQGGVREFLSCHKDLCPEFTAMLNSITAALRSSPESEELETNIASINRYFSHRTVFVYGTLLNGERNHDRYLRENRFIGNAVLCGYDIYDVGSFPAAVSGSGQTRGELYEVDLITLRRLDQLECEGILYSRKCASVITEDGQGILSLFYEFNESVEGLPRIQEDGTGAGSWSAYCRRC